MDEQDFDRSRNVGAEVMRFVNIGTQAGIFDTRLVSGFILDILKKLHEIHKTYQDCSHDLEQGRAQIDHTEQAMSSMQTTLGNFSENVDSLGVHMLQENASLANKHLALEKFRQDVALKRLHVDNLCKNQACPKDLRMREQTLYDLRQDRAKLELQLAKVNNDIDSTYEDMYNVQERLDGIQELRENRRADQCALMSTLEEKCKNRPAKISQLLSISGTDTILDMRDVYVSPAEFKQLQADVETLKHKQVQVDRHIEMQLEERDFLRMTADEICQKVYELERKVRKETGDHGFKSHSAPEPNWHQDLGNPTVWFTSPKLTLDQVKMIIEKQSKDYRITHAQPDAELPGSSTDSDDEKLVTVEMLSENRS